MHYRLYNSNNTNFSTWIYCDTLLVKMDNVEEHDLVSDKDMYLFLESAKRGGVSAISKRYAKCNVPGTENFDPNFKSIDIY